MKNILDKVRIDYSTYILVLIGLLSGYIKNIMIILVIVLVHELGHVFFFSLFKMDIESIVIYPFGGVSKVNKKIHERIYKDILISLGGIIFQGLLIIVIYLLYKYSIIVNSTYNMYISYYERTPSFTSFLLLIDKFCYKCICNIALHSADTFHLKPCHTFVCT